MATATEWSEIGLELVAIRNRVNRMQIKHYLPDGASAENLLIQVITNADRAAATLALDELRARKAERPRPVLNPRYATDGIVDMSVLTHLRESP